MDFQQLLDSRKKALLGISCVFGLVWACLVFVDPGHILRNGIYNLLPLFPTLEALFFVLMAIGASIAAIIVNVFYWPNRLPREYFRPLAAKQAFASALATLATTGAVGVFVTAFKSSHAAIEILTLFALSLIPSLFAALIVGNAVAAIRSAKGGRRRRQTKKESFVFPAFPWIKASLVAALIIAFSAPWWAGTAKRFFTTPAPKKPNIEEKAANQKQDTEEQKDKEIELARERAQIAAAERDRLAEAERQRTLREEQAVREKERLARERTMVQDQPPPQPVATKLKPRESTPSTFIPPPKKTEPEKVVAKKPSPPKTPPKPAITTKYLAEFVAGHHRKISRGDLSGAVSDFGSNAQYNGPNHYSRSQLSSILQREFGSSQGVKFEYLSPIEITRHRNGFYIAKYKVKESVTRGGRIKTRRVTCDHTIHIVDGYPKITSYLGKSLISFTR